MSSREGEDRKCGSKIPLSVCILCLLASILFYSHAKRTNFALFDKDNSKSATRLNNGATTSPTSREPQDTNHVITDINLTFYYETLSPTRNPTNAIFLYNKTISENSPDSAAFQSALNTTKDYNSSKVNAEESVNLSSDLKSASKSAAIELNETDIISVKENLIEEVENGAQKLNSTGKTLTSRPSLILPITRLPTVSPTSGITFSTEIAEKKIVNLGLPKTGTTSLQREVQDFLGGNTVSHWKDCFSTLLVPSNIKKGLCHREHMCGYLFSLAANDTGSTLLSHFYATRPAIAQPDCVSFSSFYFPQISLLERLLQESRGRTIFTLTTRHSEDWLKSVHKWNSLGNRILAHLRKGICEQFGFKSDKVANVTDSEVLVNFKEWHEERVKKLAAQYDENLFILDLNDPDTLRENFSKALAKLIDQHVEVRGYKWANKNSN